MVCIKTPTLKYIKLLSLSILILSNLQPLNSNPINKDDSNNNSNVINMNKPPNQNIHVNLNNIGGGKNSNKEKNKESEQSKIPSINFTLDGLSATTIKKRHPCVIEDAGPNTDLPTRVTAVIDQIESKTPEDCLKACNRNRECNFGRYYQSVERCYLFFAKDANWSCKVINFEFMKNF